jgi:hypothetical protein
MADYTNSDLARKIGALESQLTELRRLLLDLPAQIASAAPKTEGVSQTERGMFLPGTGLIGRDRQLSPDAQAALDALEEHA